MGGACAGLPPQASVCLLAAAARGNGHGLAATLLAGRGPGEALGVVLAGDGLGSGNGGLAHGGSGFRTSARLAACVG